MKTNKRLHNLRRKLTEKGIDSLFVSQPVNRYYLSGFDGSAGYLFINMNHALLATDSRYTEQAKIQAPDYQILRIIGNTKDWFPEVVSSLKCKRLGFETGHVTFAFYQELADIMEEGGFKLGLVPQDGLVESLRVIKEPEEIEFISRAAEIGDEAMDYFRRIVQPGMSEKQAAWEIEKFMRENGSQAVLFEPIVASGPNSALPHAKPSERTISPGEPVLVDIGAKWNNYSSDLTRTFCLGEPDGTLKKVYETVARAQARALQGVKPGMTGEEADKLARSVIDEAGYGDAFGHGLGHGVGLAVHEGPRLGAKSTDVLATGMVVTVEPGVYIPGWGGVRIEDLAIIEERGIRSISKTSKDLS